MSSNSIPTSLASPVVTTRVRTNSQETGASSIRSHPVAASFSASETLASISSVGSPSPARPHVPTPININPIAASKLSDIGRGSSAVGSSASSTSVASPFRPPVQKRATQHRQVTFQKTQKQSSSSSPSMAQTTRNQSTPILADLQESRKILVETLASTKLNSDGLKQKNTQLMALREDFNKLDGRLKKLISDVGEKIVDGLSVFLSDSKLSKTEEEPAYNLLNVSFIRITLTTYSIKQMDNFY